MGQEEGGSEHRRRSPWGALALVMLTGLALMRNGADVTMGPPQPAAAAALTGRPEVFVPATSLAPVEPLAYAPASRVKIDAIKVDAPVIEVGIDQDGWVQAPPPDDPNLAGWYQNAISPASAAPPSWSATSTPCGAPPSSTASARSRRATTSR